MPYVAKEREKAWRAEHTDRCVVHRKRYNSSPRGRHTKHWGHIFRKFGLTEFQWYRLFADQDYVCAACGTDTPGSRGWHTDHDHTKQKGDPGFIRGIVCAQCNVAFGYLEHDKYQGWLAYLAHSGETP